MARGETEYCFPLSQIPQRTVLSLVRISLRQERLKMAVGAHASFVVDR